MPPHVLPAQRCRYKNSWQSEHVSTGEQQHATDALIVGGPVKVKVKAYAGAGKTTLLRMASEACASCWPAWLE